MDETNLGPNRQLLVRVATQIAPLLPDVVFVGGQVAELLVTAPEATRIRPTDDVDIVVAATTRLDYRRVEEALSELGLHPDSSEGAPICRWNTPDGLKLDVMPLNDEVLGFGSRWYPAVVEQRTDFVLTDALRIQIPTPELYLATKWEAFLDRGADDYLGSHDLEDIITVVAGRAEILEEVAGAPELVREWLAGCVRQFLDHVDAEYAIMGALPDAAVIPGLVSEVQARFERIAARSE